MSFFKDESDETDELAPDEKDALYSALRKKYDSAADDSDVLDAQSGATRSRTMGGIGQIFSDYAHAVAQTKGSTLKGPQGIGDVANKNAAAKLAGAKETRKGRMDQVLADDEIEQKAVSRDRDSQRFGRETGQWKRDDETIAREADPNSPESKNAQALAKKLMPAGNFDGMSAAQLKGSLPSLEKMFQAEQQRLGRIDAITAQNTARKDAKDARDQDRADKQKEKDEQYQATTKIEGAEVQPGFRPTVLDADKARKAKAARDAIDRQLKELDTLYDDSGTNLVGDDAARMEGIVSDLKLQVKDLASLGALSASDIKLLEEQIPDPTSWAENAKGMAFGNDRYKAKSDQFRKTTESKYDTTLGAYGYKRSAAPAVVEAPPSGGPGTANAAPAGAPPPPAKGMVRIKAPDGSMKDVPESQKQKYLDKGGVLVP